MKPAAPGSAIGFDVQPQHVYYASYVLRSAQYDFADRARSLVDTLDGYPHAVGCGAGPEAFAKAYAAVADLFLQVWSRATEGVGGAAVGLTATANHYAQAEHATSPLSPAGNPEPAASGKLGDTNLRRLRIGVHGAAYEIDGVTVAIKILMVGTTAV
ncbi:hypothetical protein [Streptomyces sp. NPDC002769]|uniref:hypothetical protein n=1 Tax=Streptomyces sp. NPDC002769 TaxID=3154542 RepID=UPI0033219715